MFDRRFLGKGLTAGAAAALFASVLPLAVQAAPPAHRISHQQQRIQTGYKNGQITKAEYAREESRLQAISAQRKAYLRQNGGHLTAAERAKLQAELRHSSHNIYWAKHNAMTKPGIAPHEHQGWGGPLPSKNSPQYIPARINQEIARIHDGALNGSLTQPEYNHDLAALRQIEAQRNAWLKAQGGTLTASQKAQLNAQLQAESAKIYRSKHNSSDQPGM
jgi:hypothetical protein